MSPRFVVHRHDAARLHWDLRDFEGEIPEGEYGAGTVSVWDGETHDLLSEHDRRLTIAFRGKRLRGEYVLVPLEGENWLFFRTKGRGE